MCYSYCLFVCDFDVCVCNSVYVRGLLFDAFFHSDCGNTVVCFIPTAF